MNYFNFYPGDYLRDTTRLTLIEHGAYARLLMAYYAESAPLPADDAVLFVIAGAISAADKAAVRKIADRFFPVGEDGSRHNFRADLEIEKAQNVIAAAQANGRKGGRPKKPSTNPDVTQKKPSGLNLGSENGGFSKPRHKPKTNPAETQPGVGVGARASLAREELPYEAAVAGDDDV